MTEEKTSNGLKLVSPIDLISPTEEVVSSVYNLRPLRRFIPEVEGIDMDGLERLVAEKMSHLEETFRDFLRSPDMWGLYFPGIKSTKENFEIGLRDIMFKQREKIIKESIIILKKKKGYIFLKWFRGKMVHKSFVRFIILTPVCVLGFLSGVAMFFAPSSTLMLIGLIAVLLSLIIFALSFVSVKNS